MPRKKNELTNALILAPFWVSLVLAGIVYVFLSAILPSIQFNSLIFKGIASAGRPLAPLCPKCGTFMIQRTARKGPRAGNIFWGRPCFPSCRGIIND